MNIPPHGYLQPPNGTQRDRMGPTRRHHFTASQRQSPRRGVCCPTPPAAPPGLPAAESSAAAPSRGRVAGAPWGDGPMVGVMKHSRDETNIWDGNQETLRLLRVI